MDGARIYGTHCVCGCSTCSHVLGGFVVVAVPVVSVASSSSAAAAMVGSQLPSACRQEPLKGYLAPA